MTTNVLFLDLNGTCVDDWEPLYAGVQAIFGTYHLPCPSLETFVRTVGVTGDYQSFYVNRNITGAMVNRHPFGGFKMSGVGSKAGGPDPGRRRIDH